MSQEQIQRTDIPFPCNSCEKKKCNRCVAAIMSVMQGETYGHKFTTRPAFHCSCFKSNPEPHLSEVKKFDQSELYPKPYLKTSDLSKIEPNEKFTKVYEVDD